MHQPQFEFYANCRGSADTAEIGEPPVSAISVIRSMNHAADGAGFDPPLMSKVLVVRQPASQCLVRLGTRADIQTARRVSMPHQVSPSCPVLLLPVVINSNWIVLPVQQPVHKTDL